MRDREHFNPRDQPVHESDSSMTGLLFRSAGDVIARLRREQELSEHELAKQADLRVGELRDIESGVPPTDGQLDELTDQLGVTPGAVRFLAGELPEELRQSLVKDPDGALDALRQQLDTDSSRQATESNRDGTAAVQSPDPDPVYTTDQGVLYEADCRQLLPQLPDESFDLVFADPPFNLDKDYGDESDDDMAEDEYLEWCTEWIDGVIPLLKPGGSLFLYNLPKWNVHLASYLSRSLTMYDWITVDMKFGLPIPNRLYPSHYSLLHFVKGSSPKTFNPDRLPVDTCPHCGGEQKDYGGYKSKMNPKGVSLTDVWDDIPPVRHNKHLNRDANQLSIKLLHRVLGMVTEQGDRVLDPFGGAGTTYAAAEIMGREWVGTELHDCGPIVERLETGLEQDCNRIREIKNDLNVLFTEKALEKRAEYRDEFGFEFEDYDLSESTVPIQESLGSY